MVQVVQAMLHIRLKRRDAEAGHAPPGLTGLTVSWGTPGAHVVAEKGARGTRVGGGVSHSSLVVVNFLPRLLRTDVWAGWPLWPWLPITCRSGRQGPRVSLVLKIWSECSTPCGVRHAVGGAKRASARIGDRYMTHPTSVFSGAREG